MGETTAKGAMSTASTRDLALSLVGETEKTRSRASRDGHQCSPAIMMTCTRARRPKAVFWSKKSCATPREVTIHELARVERR